MSELAVIASPLSPATLAELLRATVQECRSILEHRVAELNSQTAIAVDLLADLCEEVALWIEQGPDLDATPHLAAILTLLKLVTDAEAELDEASS